MRRARNPPLSVPFRYRFLRILRMFRLIFAKESQREDEMAVDAVPYKPVSVRIPVNRDKYRELPHCPSTKRQDSPLMTISSPSSMMILDHTEQGIVKTLQGNHFSDSNPY